MFDFITHWVSGQPLSYLVVLGVAGLDVIFPLLKPIFVILTSLSVIWDFQVFTQPFLLRGQRPDPGYFLMSIYAYQKSFGISQYGLGSAIALVMLALMLVVTSFYIRQMIRIGEVA